MSTGAYNNHLHYCCLTNYLLFVSTASAVKSIMEQPFHNNNELLSFADFSALLRILKFVLFFVSSFVRVSTV